MAVVVVVLAIVVPPLVLELVVLELVLEQVKQVVVPWRLYAARCGTLRLQRRQGEG